ncbi:hypothetical protein D1007_49325 [Hordeum vulgare]|nr:hypothetical protein D1007_49325 [Hordeum vulgare]
MIGHLYTEHGDGVHPASSLIFKELRASWGGASGNRGAARDDGRVVPANEDSETGKDKDVDSGKGQLVDDADPNNSRKRTGSGMGANQQTLALFEIGSQQTLANAGVVPPSPPPMQDPKRSRLAQPGKEWLLNTLDSLPVAERHMLLLTMWRCWHVRNELVHNKDPPPVDVSRRFLCSYLDSLLCIAHESYADPCKDDSAGSGMVLRDEKGGIIFSSCRQLFYCRDALEAELGACMEGLSLALSRTDLPVAIEMESSVAVKMIQANDVDRSLYSSLVKEIKYH